MGSISSYLSRIGQVLKARREIPAPLFLIRSLCIALCYNQPALSLNLGLNRLPCFSLPLSPCSSLRVPSQQKSAPLFTYHSNGVLMVKAVCVYIHALMVLPRGRVVKRGYLLNDSLALCCMI